MRLSDAVNARHAAKAAIDAKHDRREARIRAPHVIPAGLHPAVGVLQGAKGVRFYVFEGGAMRLLSREDAVAYKV